MENQNINSKAYVEGGKALLYDIVSHSGEEYIHYRLLLEKSRCGHKYKESTIQRANDIVQELVEFFKGEFATGMANKSSEEIFAGLEKQVDTQLTEWKKLNGIEGFQKPKRKRGRPRKS